MMEMKIRIFIFKLNFLSVAGKPEIVSIVTDCAGTKQDIMIWYINLLSRKTL